MNISFKQHFFNELPELKEFGHGDALTGSFMAYGTEKIESSKISSVIKSYLEGIKPSVKHITVKSEAVGADGFARTSNGYICIVATYTAQTHEQIDVHVDLRELM